MLFWCAGSPSRPTPTGRDGLSRRDSDLSQLSQADELPDVHADREAREKREYEARAATGEFGFGGLHINDAYDTSARGDDSSHGEGGEIDTDAVAAAIDYERRAAEELGVVPGERPAEARGADDELQGTATIESDERFALDDDEGGEEGFGDLDFAGPPDAGDLLGLGEGAGAREPPEAPRGGDNT